jgi:hydroxymethylpyrimidine/phosphomethylpyrimidine kinase
MPVSGRVLVIAGSDSGGGAGIQADIKTVAALGGYATTAITALTAQNTLDIRGILPVPPDFVALQIETVLTDIGADCIKTGMLGTAEVAEAVADSLDRLAPAIPLVVDPVMTAGTGGALLSEEARQILVRRLLPRAALVTPNIPEAERMLGRSIPDRDAMERAARDLLDRGCRAVLLKGGHLPGDTVTDILAIGADCHILSEPRLGERSPHGTGCTLASAVAAGLAAGQDLFHAVAGARAYVRRAIATAPALGRGNGPLDHMGAAP